MKLPRKVYHLVVNGGPFLEPSGLRVSLRPLQKVKASTKTIILPLAPSERRQC